MLPNVGLVISVLQLTVSYIMTSIYENGGFIMRYNIKGICKIYHEEEGWGWISIEGEDDVWVHFSSVQMDGFKSLTKGDVVSFDLEENPSLKEQSRRAVNVKRLVKFK